MSFTEKFRCSARELSRIECVAIAGMLLALRVVLGYFSNLSLAFLPEVKFGFNYLPIAIAGILFGPVVAAAVGGFGDIISYILSPMGAYFPGWTINGILMGLMYGIFLYKNNVTLPKLILCSLIIAIFIELLLGTTWLHLQLGFPFIDKLIVRGIKQAIFTPIEIAVIFIVSSAFKHIKVPIFQREVNK